MKKVIIACAAVLALGLASCGETNMCYKITFTDKSNGNLIAEYYQYGTSNEIDAYIAQQKKVQEAIFGADAIKVTRSTLPSLKSKEDCKGGSISL